MIKRTDKAVAKIFGERLRQARLAMGMSQGEFGNVLMLSITTVSGLERGANVPNVLTVMHIAKLLNVTTDWLLGMDEFTDAVMQEAKQRRIDELERQLKILRGE